MTTSPAAPPAAAALEPLAPLPTAEIEGHSARFPVGRIFCVGRNYAAHAREMGSDPTREPPFFFTKFPQALVPGGGSIPYPPGTSDYQHEGELVLAIGRAASAVPVEHALDLVFGYAAGLDMTRRDLQLAAKAAGKPWDIAKNFAYAAPLGAIRAVADRGHLREGALRLTVNGATRQQGRVEEMIWSPAEVLSHLSRFERLLPGDLVFTGTPAGVSAVVPGDVVEVSIDGLAPLSVRIEPAAREA